MADDAPKSRTNIYQAPGIQTGYAPDDAPPIPAVEPAPPPLTGDERGRDNRGHRAAVTASGEVIGSGAGAGGKGGPEDFDLDPQSGGGTFELGHPDRPDRGADSSQHNSG